MLVVSSCTTATDSNGPGSAGEGFGTTVDVGASSAPPGASGTPLEGIDGGSIADADPVGSFVAEAFGHDLQLVQAAVEGARTEVMAVCMAREGWEFAPTPPPALDPSDPGPVPRAEELLRELRGGERSPEAPGGESRDPRAYNEDLVRCHRDAVEAVSDPVVAVFEWLDVELSDLYERVAADPRVVEALEAEDRCLTEAGHADPAAEEAEVIARAEEVAAEVRSGRIPEDRAVGELEELAARQRTLWEVVDRCSDPRLEVERRVAAALEAEWLEGNRDRLALVLAELEPAIAALADDLVAVEARR